MEQEIWKPIPGYEGSYEASSFGRIKSISRLINSVMSRSGQRLTKEKMLKQCLDGAKRYLHVNLSKEGIPHAVQVHRIIAQLFLLDDPNCKEVNHKDGDPTNNHMNNLEWVTRSGNEQHKHHVLNRKITIPSQQGHLHKQARKVRQLSQDGTIIKEYSCIKYAEKDGFSSVQIISCCRGKYKSHLGYRWEYA